MARRKSQERVQGVMEETNNRYRDIFGQETEVG